jgi:CheY-like chemotaxis protein
MDTIDLPPRPLVLIVDDDADTRELYAAYLRNEGFRVEVARHGLEAVERTFKVLPDVILMDLLMPTLDGWEAMRLLRSRPHTRRIPIIALTGDKEIRDLKLAKNAGCDVVLLKPCAPEEVRAAIRRLTDTARVS